MNSSLREETRTTETMTLAATDALYSVAALQTLGIVLNWLMLARMATAPLRYMNPLFIR
jgi:hypothetical protein